MFANFTNLVKTLICQPSTFRQDQIPDLWHKLDDASYRLIGQQHEGSEV